MRRLLGQKLTIFGWLSVFFFPLGNASVLTDNDRAPKHALSYSSLPDQVCGIEVIDNVSDNTQILNRYGEKSDNSIQCTATVIGARTLLTAGHCAYAAVYGAEYNIICPGGIKRRFKMEKQGFVPSNFKLSAMPAHDVGIIELDQDLGIAPAKVVQTRKELSKYLRNPAQCYEIGFGEFHDAKNNDYEGLVNGTILAGQRIDPISQVVELQYGELFAKRQQEIIDKLSLSKSHAKIVSEVAAALLDQSETFLNKNRGALSSPYLFVHGNGVAGSPGDSGGPLMCIDEKGNPVVIGIISHGLQGLSDHFSSALYHKDWIKKFIKNTSTPSLKSAIQALEEQIRYRCEQIGTCLNIVDQRHIRLTADTLDVLETIRRQEGTLSTKNDSELLNQLLELEDEFKKFIEHCFKKAEPF